MRKEGLRGARRRRLLKQGRGSFPGCGVSLAARPLLRFVAARAGRLRSELLIGAGSSGSAATEGEGDGCDGDSASVSLLEANSNESSLAGRKRSVLRKLTTEGAGSTSSNPWRRASNESISEGCSASIEVRSTPRPEELLWSFIERWKDSSCPL